MDIKREKNISDKTELRKSLRHSLTPAEATLWKLLKGKQIDDYRFRRQYGIGNYVLDFYCPKLKLAIELDGDYHYHGGAIQRDIQRDEYLTTNHNIVILRFENRIVFEQPEAIINSIRQHAEKINNSRRRGIILGGGSYLSEAGHTSRRRVIPLRRKATPLLS